jgi:hypothetical protein
MLVIQDTYLLALAHEKAEHSFVDTLYGRVAQAHKVRRDSAQSPPARTTARASRRVGRCLV